MPLNRRALIRDGVQPDVMVTAGMIEQAAILAKMLLEIAAFHVDDPRCTHSRTVRIPATVTL